MCELFDQYIRKGHKEGVKEGIIALITVCRDVKLSFEETAERVRSGFHLEDAEVQENMRLYW